MVNKDRSGKPLRLQQLVDALPGHAENLSGHSSGYIATDDLDFDHHVPFMTVSAAACAALT